MNRRESDRDGDFVVIDGLDGIGKGEIERALIEYDQKLGRAVFDLVAFSRAHRKGLPELVDFWNPPEVYYDTIVTAEPTYAGIGHQIRNEIVASNGRDYSAEAQIAAYSLDRLIQMKRVVIPAIRNGMRVLQSRCLASTWCYQSLTAEKEGKDVADVRKRILEHEGNKMQLAYAPDLLIIPTIDDVGKVIDRIHARKEMRKDDKSIFDNVEFQGRLKPLYESPELKKLFEKHGSKVVYIDAGISVDESRRQAVDAYRTFLDNRKK